MPVCPCAAVGQPLSFGGFPHAECPYYLFINILFLIHVSLGVSAVPNLGVSAGIILIAVTCLGVSAAYKSLKNKGNIENPAVLAVV